MRHLLGQRSKVGALFQGIVDRVHTNLGSLLLFLGCLLVETKKDMRSLDKTVGANLLNRVVIDVMSLLQHIGISHHSRHYLLVAILCKLLTERGQRIEMSIEGCSHFQLIVDKKVNILLDRLLINNPLRVVLVIAILKLRAQDILAVHSHDHRIDLRHSVAKYKRKNNKEGYRHPISVFHYYLFSLFFALFPLFSIL